MTLPRHIVDVTSDGAKNWTGQDWGRWPFSFLLTILLAHSLAAGAEKTFRAGTAEVAITPAKPMPMWGYGARHDLLSRGTRDPLLAKAIVIEAGGSRLAIVGLDLGRSPGEPQFSRIREAVKKASGVEHILMSGSHTHHGPVLELKDVPGQGQGKFADAVAYVGELEQKLIAVINEAATKLQDARIGWESALVDLNRNRHAKREPKSRDTELAVIRVDDMNGQPLAILVNFAAHPTVLNGSDLRWSAEYPGAMMRTVERALKTRCIFIPGASGDLSVQSGPEANLTADDPRLAADALDREQAAFIKAQLKLGAEEVQKLQREIIAADFRMEAFGRRLGEEVLRLTEGCETRLPKRPSLKGIQESFSFESRVDMRNSAIVTMFSFAFFPELAAAAAAEYQDNRVHPVLTTVLLNGELALIGGSGEFFCNHANRLKERSYSAKTLFFGYCNGHHMYFPTIEAVSQGGYGADAEVSWVEVGAGERMMNQALINIFTLQGKITRSPLAPQPASP